MSGYGFSFKEGPVGRPIGKPRHGFTVLRTLDLPRDMQLLAKVYRRQSYVARAGQPERFGYRCSDPSHNRTVARLAGKRFCLIRGCTGSVGLASVRKARRDYVRNRWVGTWEPVRTVAATGRFAVWDRSTGTRVHLRRSWGKVSLEFRRVLVMIVRRRWVRESARALISLGHEWWFFAICYVFIIRTLSGWVLDAFFG